MIRLLYSLVWAALLPAVLVRLWWRGAREPGYRRHIGERLGRYAPHPPAPRLWVHAVSAGETRAAEPLVRALLKRYPAHRILLTHMTATGRDTSNSLFADQRSRLDTVFLPYDLPFILQRFLRHFRPECCILIETEVWPNLIAGCTRHAIPVALANARLSEKSLRQALRLAPLMLPAARAIRVVAAQSQPDAQRLAALGLPTPGVTGNMKFDVTPPPDITHLCAHWRTRLNRPRVFLCASTREGEEARLLDTWQARWRGQADAPLLILTPRHPQRFDSVAALLDARQIRYQRRSTLPESAALADDTEILLGDSMGEMYLYYGICDLAFVGGSLVPLGGHNLIEACAMARPVLIGPHTFNFSEISDQAIAAGAVIRVEDAHSLFTQVDRLFDAAPEKQAMSRAAEGFFRAHQGATARTLALLAPALPKHIP